MKKYILSILAIPLISAGMFFLLSFLGIFAGGSGALQVTANIKSKVYLNEKYVGDTPLCKCTKGNILKKGEYDLKIIPDDKNLSPFLYKIKIEKGVLALLDRTFLPGSFASATVLSLEKTDSKDPQLLVTSIPEEAMLSLDGEPKGITPFLIKNISSFEHELKLNKDGFSEKTIKIKPVEGYKLIANLIMGTKNDKDDKVPDLFSSQPPEETASKSADTKNTLVKIKPTPNGFLRVRKEPSIGSPEIARVKPGDTFAFLSEKDGWFQIKLTDGKTGWVSSDYSQKMEK